MTFAARPRKSGKIWINDGHVAATRCTRAVTQEALVTCVTNESRLESWLKNFFRPSILHFSEVIYTFLLSYYLWEIFHWTERVCTFANHYAECEIYIECRPGLSILWLGPPDMSVMNVFVLQNKSIKCLWNVESCGTCKIVRQWGINNYKYAGSIVGGAGPHWQC